MGHNTSDEAHVASRFRVWITHRLLSLSSSSHRILNTNHKKELLRSLWVGFRFGSGAGPRVWIKVSDFEFGLGFRGTGHVAGVRQQGTCVYALA